MGAGPAGAPVVEGVGGGATQAAAVPPVWKKVVKIVWPWVQVRGFVVTDFESFCRKLLAQIINPMGGIDVFPSVFAASKPCTYRCVRM